MEAACMKASFSAQQLEQCFPTAMLVEAFCPSGKWTLRWSPHSLLAHRWIHGSMHASCGYLSVVIARVRDCFSVSSCVSPPEREGTTVWTLMSVMSVTHGSEEGKCALGQSVMKLVAQLLALMDKTVSFQLVLGETFQPSFHGMVCHALELFRLHHVLGVPPLTERLDSCEPLHFCDWCKPHRPSDQTKCLPGSDPCQGPVDWSLLWLTTLWSNTRDGVWLFPGTLFLVFSRLLPRWYQQVCEE